MRRLGLVLSIVCGLLHAPAAFAQPVPDPPPVLDPEPASEPAPAPAPASEPPPVDAMFPPAELRPIKVAVVCEETGRTKVCPSFVNGFIDANEVLLLSPRAGADVVLYVTASQVALVDRVHLRFVGRMTEAPTVTEVDVDVASRGTDDQQRAQLEPAFLRGIAVYVGARHPEAVTVTLSAPAGAARPRGRTTAWGFGTGGEAYASYTEKYRAANGNFNIRLSYITTDFRVLVAGFANGGVNRQPPLTLDDGTIVDLDSYSWGASGGAEAIKLLDAHWSVGIGSYTEVDDPRAQYRVAQRTRAAIAYDEFRADDPRGNRLEIFYHLGSAYERYNLRNELGEDSAWYGVHGIDAVGSVRHDRITYGLRLDSNVQLDHPRRRYALTASPYTTIQLGDHLDLSLSFSVTKHELPGPDPAVIDPSDFQQLSRLQFAEPLSMNASVSIDFHWDATNGQRNDRIGSI